MLFEFEYGWRDGCREGGRIGDLQYNHDLYAEYQVPSMYCTVAMNITFLIYPRSFWIIRRPSSSIRVSTLNPIDSLPFQPWDSSQSPSLYHANLRGGKGMQWSAVECSGVQCSGERAGKGGVSAPQILHVMSIHIKLLCCAVLCCAVLFLVSRRRMGYLRYGYGEDWARD